MIDRIVIVLAYVWGAGSLVLFAVLGGPLRIDLGFSDPAALAFDAALSLAFFLQHSLMVRRPVKARLVRLVPARYLGAIYAIASGVVLTPVALLWQRTELRFGAVTGPLRWLALAIDGLALAGFAWGIASLRRHFDPLGIHPIRAHRRGRPERPASLTVRGPYRWVRHPLYTCILVLLWSPLDLGADKILLAVLWSGWIVVATFLEERDLVAEMGEPYRAYRRAVPMLIPWRRAAPVGSSAPR